MKCPYCKAPAREVRVIDTRHTEAITRRRRQCDLCNERFSTMEVVTVDGQTVTNADLLLLPKNRKVIG